MKISPNVYVKMKKGKRQLTYFAKISDDVTSIAISNCHDVEKERVDIKVKSFVIEEELG